MTCGTSNASALALAALLAVSAAGCKRSRVDAFAHVLVEGQALDAYNRLPLCAPLDDAPKRRCLDNIARAFDGEAFVTDPPDHASASAAALFVVRDHAGYALPEARVWNAVLESREGKGADVFRLAVGRALREARQVATAPPRDDATMRASLGAIAGAVPGACVTYRLLAEGKPAATLAPELRPEHSPCVQRDLSEPDAPGPTFGDGLPRALAGAGAAWRRTVRLLRAGLEKTHDRNTRARLADDLKYLDEVTFVAPSAAPAVPALEFVHGHLDAGAIARDAGARDAGR